MDSTLSAKIGRKVRECRKLAGLSQEDVANDLGITGSGFAQIERGLNLISVEHLLKLPAILGCRLTDLLPDSAITDYDRARSKDIRLDYIVQHWDELSAEAKEAVVFVATGGIVSKR